MECSSSQNPGRTSELKMLQKQHEDKVVQTQELKRQIETVKLQLEERKNDVSEAKMEAFRRLSEQYNSIREEYNALLAEKSRKEVDEIHPYFNELKERSNNSLL